MRGRHRRTILQLTPVFFTLVACSAGPSDPGPSEPSGRIFFGWIPEVGTRPQPWVYGFAEAAASRVPIWFDQGRYPSTDTAGTVLTFSPPGTDLIVISLQDSTQLEAWPKASLGVSYPSLSQDGARLAWTRPVGGNDNAIDILDRSSGQIMTSVLFEGLANVRVVHWFSGDDSVLVTGSIGNGTPVYHVMQSDGSRTDPFGFAPADGTFKVAVSNDGHWIALGGPRPGGVLDEASFYRIEVWDLRRRALHRQFILSHHVGHLAWSPDGRYLAHAPFVHATRESTLEILDRESGERNTVIPYVSDPAYASFLTWTR